MSRLQALLALDTSSPVGSVAVGSADRLLAEVVMGVSVRHAEALMPAIDFALQRAALRPADLDGIVVAGGPGSFTGVRIAGAAAKGMARALGVPLYSYSGLLALAAGAAASDRPVCALFDARREEVYAAAYAFDEPADVPEPADAPASSAGPAAQADGDVVRVAPRMLLEPAPRALEDVIAAMAGQAPLWIGDGALKHRARLRRAGGRVAPTHLAVARAAALLWLVEADPSGLVADPAAWEPAYLRPSGAERAACG